MSAASADQTWDRIEIDTPGPSETGRLVDIDGDGQLDVLPNGTTFAAWYSFTRQPTANQSVEVRWTKHELPMELAGHGIGSGDINGDGRVDLVGPKGWAEAPANPRQDRWLWHPEFQLFRDGSVPILVHDVDGDGDADLIWGRGHNVGLYWTEQHRQHLNLEMTDSVQTWLTHVGEKYASTLDQLLGRTAWTTHAIDTSWSCLHAPLLADLDGDGNVEIIAGKRYQGHEGKDPARMNPCASLVTSSINCRARGVAASSRDIRHAAWTWIPSALTSMQMEIWTSSPQRDPVWYCSRTCENTLAPQLGPSNGQVLNRHCPPR